MEAWLLSPTTFWRGTPPKKPCPGCKANHNQSIHGYIAYCPTHPLHKAWLAAWGPHSPTHAWRAYTQRRGVFLTGKPAIPESLFAYLSRQLGTKGAKKAVASFQANVLNLLHAAPPAILDHHKTPRPSPYIIADLDIAKAPPKAMAACQEIG